MDVRSMIPAGIEKRCEGMLDLLIKDAAVIDGTGRPVFKVSVGIKDERIVLVKPEITQEAERIIDARGLHLAPGFIDPHTHSDLSLLVNPKAESKIRQGVTTEVIGNCGDSPAPLRGAALEEVRASAEAIELEVDWSSMAEYLERLRVQGTAVNVYPLVGHNTVRGAVMGYDDRQPTPEEQAEMEATVAQALEEGVRGLSTGLYYPPGYYAQTEEVIGLAKVAARYGGIYASHIRSETDLLLESVAEAIEIGERAGITVEISHVKLEGYRNWSGVDRLFALLEEAQGKGVKVGCDQYPYIASSTWLAAILPYWAQAGGTKAVAQRVSDPAVRSQLRRDWAEKRIEWDNRSGIKDWDDILISNCDAKPEYLGMTIAEIAYLEGKDPLDIVFNLLVETEGQVACVFFDQSEENVRALMRHPLVVVGSDGYALSPYGVLSKRKPHPRSYGTFPRVLGHYVREEKVLSLEEAVKKMTSVTASRLGLTERGLIREGAWADLVLFDAETIIDRATFTKPHQYPTGIPYVIVNGLVIIDRGEHSGALAGQVL